MTTRRTAPYDLGRPRALAAIVAVVVVLMLPWTYGSVYLTNQIAQIAFLALLAASLNLNLGYAGELAVGQVAMTAVSAYTVAYIAMEVSAEIWLTLPLAVFLGLIVGAVIGAPGLRLGAWSLGVVTLYAVIVLPNVVNLTRSFTGGFNGRYGVPQPQIFGYVLGNDGVFVVTVIVLAVWCGVARNFVRSRHGAALHALRASPIVTTSVGVGTYQFKLFVYMFAAIPAALAGVLFVYRVQFVHPSSFSFELVVEVIAVSLLGGSRSIVFGPLAGATILQLGLEQSADFSDASLLVFGLLLVICGLLLPNGLAGVASAGWARWGFAAHARGPSVELHRQLSDHASARPIGARRSFAGARLDIVAVSKRFGGLQALRSVSLSAEPGRVTALIGGNGSGKTTLVNLASGYLRADEGTVLLDGVDVAGTSPAWRALHGLRRTFQTPIIPDTLSTVEVVSTARYRSDRLGLLATVLRTPNYRRVHAADHRAAMSAIEACGLQAHADALASTLPLGLRRLTEVARAVAGEPKLLLLDEPAAGLDEDEIAALQQVIDRLRRQGMTILLIEHNFEFVRSLADVVHVLDQGSLLATGTPEEVVGRADVLGRYFGEHVAAASDAEDDGELQAATT